MGTITKKRIPLFLNGIQVFTLPSGQLWDYFFSGLIIFIIFLTAFSLFFIIGKWAFRHHSDFIVFLPLVAFLSFAFLNMGLSIFSMFQAYRLPYMLPAQIYEIPKEHTNTDVRHLKEIFLERLAGDAKKNALSNERKMRLLNHSRTFLLYGLTSLGLAFVYICCKLYLSFIIS